MDSRLFILGGLAVLMLFGCTGAKTQAKQPAGNIGDSDIAPAQAQNEDVLPSDDLVPPPFEDNATNTTSMENGNQTLTHDISKLDLTDVSVDTGEDPELISTEDIVEPG
jgi:hypothetical protein